MPLMLSDEQERLVQRLVQSGRFATQEEAVSEALHLLARQDQVEQAEVLDGIRRGIEDMQAGRGQPAEEVFAAIRREFNLSTDA